MLSPKAGWQELRTTVQSKWGALTDDDVTEFDGRKDVLVGKIQQRYGIGKLQAERDVEAWLAGQPC